MAELKKPKNIHDQLFAHVVFVHGLDGNLLNTWQSSGQTPEYWPDWLTEDYPNIAVWSLGYPADASRWKKDGGAMALPDRATNILQTLLNEPALRNGPIIFIGYSLGGLVVKETLRHAEVQAPHNTEIANFLRRVRRIALLGTPNLGSDLAYWANKLFFLYRPRETVAGLNRNDPHLRSLNYWFRGFVPKNNLEILVLHETKPTSCFVTTVKPDSADPGLSPNNATVVAVDEDHRSICRPPNREAEVYRHISAFVCRCFNKSHPDTLIAHQVSAIANGVNTVHSEVMATKSEVLDKQDEILNSLNSGMKIQESSIVTTEAERRLLIIRKSRFIVGFKSEEECNNILSDIRAGELSSTAKDTRRKIFAWCSRVLAPINLAAAKKALEDAKTLGPGDENVIAEAFLIAFENNDSSSALSVLTKLNSQMARSAGFIVAAKGTTPDVPIKWLKDANLTVEDLDPDGKYKFIQRQIMLNDWMGALTSVENLSDQDFTEAPVLQFVAASIYLAQVVHPDQRERILANFTAILELIPLGTDAVAMEFRSKAKSYYEIAATSFYGLGQERAGDIASDYALWLSLKDPNTNANAYLELKSSMAASKDRLRRLPMAIAFGLALDFQTVEREIDRETTLSGGKSTDAAFARYAVAMSLKTPEEVAAYIRKHRSQLNGSFKLDLIDSIEIEALARAGRIPDARSALSKLEQRDPPPEVLEQLTKIIDEFTEGDPIGIREEQYTSSGSLLDLLSLVQLLKEQDAFPKLVVYGKILFEETKDLSSAIDYAKALYEIGQNNEITKLAETYPELLEQSPALTEIVSWAYYRLGNLAVSKRHLSELENKRNNANDRYLFMNIAIASGDWNSLGAFVESEWSNKEQREPFELLRAGNLAQRIGALPRSQELIRAAAAKADGNPEILVGCYNAATSAGWENDPVIHDWLNEAIKSSGENGPIKQFDLKEVVEMQSDWNDREKRAWELQLSASVPSFAAARLINRTLLDVYLRPALLNLRQPDPRRRSLIFAFSGALRLTSVPGKRLGVDITTIFNLALVGLLNDVIEWSGQITIAHTTMFWLFEEHERLEFHQPTQVRKALEVKRLIDQGLLHRFEGAPPPPHIEEEVGDEIARYLVAATILEKSDPSQKIIIRPFPLSKPGTLMDEPADTSSYENSFAGCVDLINSLRMRGSITASEEEKALSYLNIHEKPWPHSPTIHANATLYLDNVAVAFLQHLELLDRLAPAGFKVYISASTVDHGDALVQHDGTSKHAKEVVESIRAILANGIITGKVKLGSLVQNTTDNDVDSFQQHPTYMLFSETSEVDAFAIDDRFYNQHSRMEANNKLIPIVTSIDLINELQSEKKITSSAVIEASTKVRQAGLVLIPHRQGEIRDLLNASDVIDGVVQETAELRAIRESILRIRMTDTVQLPKESIWIDNLLRESIDTIRSQWNETISDEDARARSNWLLQLIDTRGWTHVTRESTSLAANRYRAEMMMLLLLPGATESVSERYWCWLEDAALRQFKEEDKKTYEEMISLVEGIISDAMKQNSGNNTDG